MVIRRLTGADAEAYYELRLEALLTNPDAFITTYNQEKQKSDPIGTTAERLNNEKNRTFGLYIQEKLCGVVTIVRGTHPKFQHKAEIVGMYVTPDARRHGGARKLIERVLSFAKDVDIEIIQLGVVTDNMPAKSLYERMGFKTFGIEEKAIKLEGRYLDEEHMTLHLS